MGSEQGNGRIEDHARRLKTLEDAESEEQDARKYKRWEIGPSDPSGMAVNYFCDTGVTQAAFGRFFIEHVKRPSGLIFVVTFRGDQIV